MTPAAAIGDGASTGSAIGNEGAFVFQPSDSAENSPTINVQLVFDASGSMAEQIGGETKIDSARRAMENLIAQIPDGAGEQLNVGFRVFGHRSDNTEAGRGESCQSTELRVPVDGVDKAALGQQALAWCASMWSALALRQKWRIPCAVGARTAAVAMSMHKTGLRLSRRSKTGPGTRGSAATCVSRQSARTASGSAMVQFAGSVRGRTSRGRRAVIYRGSARFLGIEGGIDTADPLVDGYTRIELEPGTYQFTVFYPANRVALRQGVSEVTYTAVIAEGQETIARIGIGGIVLEDNSGGAVNLCVLVLEQARETGWEHVRGIGRTPCANIQRVGDYGAQVNLAVGSYRLSNAERGGAATEFTIEAGKLVTIAIE
ncbi:hypothetical protein HC891_06685 [Candidatus Gracilibacteria bacterium]|nr:hypothetical protein [Candidatus Gracilibacteria bacterium]